LLTVADQDEIERDMRRLKHRQWPMFRAFAAKQERVGKYSAEFALCDCDDNCRRSAESPGPAAMQGRIDHGLGDGADSRD
jgi:hypothetical protein